MIETTDEVWKWTVKIIKWVHRWFIDLFLRWSRVTEEGDKPAGPWEEAPIAACVLSLVSLTLVQVGRAPAGPERASSPCFHICSPVFVPRQAVLTPLTFHSGLCVRGSENYKQMTLQWGTGIKGEMVPRPCLYYEFVYSLRVHIRCHVKKHG